MKIKMTPPLDGSLRREPTGMAGATLALRKQTPAPSASGMTGVPKAGPERFSVHRAENKSRNLLHTLLQLFLFLAHSPSPLSQSPAAT